AREKHLDPPPHPPPKRGEGSGGLRKIYNTMSRLLKKNATSRAAVSGASEPCVAFFSTSMPNSLRIVPRAALAGSVAPIRSRHFAIAPSPPNAITPPGPDDMYSQSEP